jgi:hypothetical protein
LAAVSGPWQNEAMRLTRRSPRKATAAEGIGISGLSD